MSDFKEALEKASSIESIDEDTKSAIDKAIDLIDED